MTSQEQEREQALQRQRDAANASWNAAAHHFGTIRPGQPGAGQARPWEQLDWDAPSMAEQAYQQQQAEYDRHRRWVQYAAEKSGTVLRADGTPVEYDVTTPASWFQ